MSEIDQFREGYRRGYEDGKADAERGKPLDRSWRAMKFVRELQAARARAKEMHQERKA